MSKIREILMGRRREVVAEIEAAVGSLQTELREIDAALDAIGGPPDRDAQHVASHRRRRRLSIADQTMLVLKGHPDGLKTSHIAAELNRQFERKIANRNVSWHLSHLKRDGRVILDGTLWRISSAKYETPDSS